MCLLYIVADEGSNLDAVGGDLRVHQRLGLD